MPAEVQGHGKFLKGAVELIGPGRVLDGPGVFQLHGVAHARDPPDQLNVVLGAGVENLVARREFFLGSAPPAFRQKISEQVRVFADHPEQPARALGAPENKIHPQQAGGAQMIGHGLGGVCLESARHMSQIDLAVGAAHGLLVLGRPFQQLVIHQRVGKLPMAVAQQLLLAGRSQNDVGGLHVNHIIPFLAQFMDDQARDLGEKFRAAVFAETLALRRFHRIQAVDPSVNDDVLAQNINLDAGMLRDLGANFIFRTSGLPQLQPFAGHINGQGQLGANADAGGANPALAQLHQQGKFLEGTVELGVDKFIDSQSVQRHIFAHPRPFNHQTEAAPVDGAGGELVNGACAVKPFAFRFKPFWGEPVFQAQMAPESRPKRCQVEVAAVAGFQVQIIDSQQGDGCARRSARRQHHRWLRRGFARRLRERLAWLGFATHCRQCNAGRFDRASIGLA